MRRGNIARRAVTILSTMILLLTGTATAAHATAAHATAERATVLAAWDCPAGNLCVWNDYEGKGSRCSWANADNDWGAAPVTCSWAPYNKVKSMYNRGQNTSYLGVLLYTSANYPSTGLWDCLAQGHSFSFISGVSDGVWLASHRWTSSFPYC